MYSTLYNVIIILNITHYMMLNIINTHVCNVHPYFTLYHNYFKVKDLN